MVRRYGSAEKFAQAEHLTIASVQRVPVWVPNRPQKNQMLVRFNLNIFKPFLRVSFGRQRNLLWFSSEAFRSSKWWTNQCSLPYLVVVTLMQLQSVAISPFPFYRQSSNLCWALVKSFFIVRKCSFLVKETEISCIFTLVSPFWFYRFTSFYRFYPWFHRWHQVQSTEGHQVLVHWGAAIEIRASNNGFRVSLLRQGRRVQNASKCQSFFHVLSMVTNCHVQNYQDTSDVWGGFGWSRVWCPRRILRGQRWKLQCFGNVWECLGMFGM